MDAKHRAAQALTVLALLTGCLLSVGSLGAIAVLAYRRVGDVWVFLSLVLFLGLAACLFSFGFRGLRWSRGMSSRNLTRFAWERVVIGVWVLFCLGLSIFQPSPYFHRPVEDKEPKEMLGVWISMAILGGGLILTGIKSRPKG